VLRSAVLLVVLYAPSVVHAQGVGFVGGGTVDPEMFYVGTFFEAPPIGQRVHLRPGVDGLWGSDLKIASINIDVVYRVDTGSGWQFYTGGGPAILIIRVDEGSVVEVRDHRVEDDVTGGLVGVLGFAHTNGFMAEFKFGRARGGPSLRFGAGFKF
jgi:hypothetical protein